jgi:hypothetical protein
MSSTEVTLISSYAALKATKPTEQGQRVLLTGWNEGTNVGGGYFIGYLVNRNVVQKYSDGGIIAHGKDYYWERVVSDPSKLTVLEFGAIADGKTDIADAALAMHKWTFSNYPGLGIQLPSGKLFLSKLSMLTESSYFRISGPPVNFGYFASTFIVTDTGPVDDKGQPVEEFLIDVKHRWVEISNIIFEGVSTVDKPNKKGIFRNNVAGGQYFNGRCIKFNKIGGKCISLLDTLDSKIDQFYTSQCTGDVIVGGWSDQAKGSWNHSTALELTNFNIQNHRVGKVFDLQRCTQALIRNGWIEHSDNPGTLSGGHWTIENLSMEDCNSQLKVSCAQLTEINKNIQGNLSGIDYTRDDSDQWLSEWERGRVDINPYGVYVERSLEPGTLMSRYKMTNMTNGLAWFQLGMFYMSEEGDSLDINMVGCGNILSTGTALDDVDGVRQGGGNTLIRIHLLQNGGVGATLQPVGSSPVLAAKYVKVAAGKVMVYVQLKPYTRNVIPMITATSKTRYEAGVSYYFTPDIKQIADITTVTGSVDILEQWSMGHNAGVGVTNDGNLILKGKVENGHLAIKVNMGTDTKPNIQTRYLQLKTEAK